MNIQRNGLFTHLSNNYLNKTAFALVLTSVFACNTSSEKQLPIYNPSDFRPELVDKSLQNKSNNHTVTNFSLINQNGDTITQETYKGKIYVADFFFTRCPTICPIITNNMVKLQNEFIDYDDSMLLSLSVTPEIDSI